MIGQLKLTDFLKSVSSTQVTVNFEIPFQEEDDLSAFGYNTGDKKWEELSQGINTTEGVFRGFDVNIAAGIYEKVFVVRKTDIDQSLQLKNLGRFNSEQIEALLDQFAMILQDQQGQIDRSVKLEVGTDSTNFSPVIKGNVKEDGAVITSDGATFVADTTLKDGIAGVTRIEGEINTKSEKVTQNLTEIQNIKAEIVAITGHDTDPTTVHNVYSLENLVKLMKTYVYGQAHTWDWDSSVINQYYRDLSNDPLYPKINNLQPVFKAYVLARYGAGDFIHNLSVRDNYGVILNPVLLRELQLTVGNKNEDGNEIGAKLQVISKNYIDGLDFTQKS